MTRTINQRDGSFGYHLLNIYKAPHPSTDQKNRPFGLLFLGIRNCYVRNYTIFLECCFIIDKFA